MSETRSHATNVDHYLVPLQNHRPTKFDRRYSQLADKYSSLEEMTAALPSAGLESSNLNVGMDFTKSNKSTGARSFQRKCLYQTGDGLNPYKQAISNIGETLKSFDDDYLIPCFGFGNATTDDEFVFPVYPTDEEIIEFHSRRKVEKRLMSTVEIFDFFAHDLRDTSNPRHGKPIFSTSSWMKQRNRRNYLNDIRGGTKNGYWRDTGSDKPIYSSKDSMLIGLRKSFAFYHSQRDGESMKTDWIMDTFWLPETSSTRPPNGLDQLHSKDSPVICRISAPKGAYHYCLLEHECSSESMQDNIYRGMLRTSSGHPPSYHNYTTYNSSIISISNTTANEATNQEHFETRIDMNHHAIATEGNEVIRATYSNPTDFFYIVVALILALTGQAVFTLIGLSSSPTLNCIGAGTVVGFLGSLSAMLLRYKLPKLARYLGKVSVFIGAASVVAVYAARFHSEINWIWGLIYGVVLLIPCLAVLFA